MTTVIFNFLEYIESVNEINFQIDSTRFYTFSHPNGNTLSDYKKLRFLNIVK